MKNTKYFKTFKQHTNYEIFKENNNIFPHMSYCEDYNEIHFNHDTQIIITFNVLDDNSETYIYTGDDEDPNFNTRDQFSKIEIDGTEINLNDLPIQSAEYPLSVGTHIIKYTLIEPIIKDYTFCACNCITDVIIPKYVKYLEFGAFEECTNLVNVTLSNGIISIGDQVFSGCYGIKHIIVPNSVKTIGCQTFCCYNLETITIGKGVTQIGDQALQIYSDETETLIFKFLSPNPPEIFINTFDWNANTVIFYVPAESVNAYKTAPFWLNYANIIQAIPEE